MSDLTIKQAQLNQPWAVPYSPALINAQNNGVNHILASHCVLHAIKSLGKLAAVFEVLDHSDYRFISDDELQIVKSMSADLVTAALRFANLYQFDLETVLRERVLEKNGVGY